MIHSNETYSISGLCIIYKVKDLLTANSIYYFKFNQNIGLKSIYDVFFFILPPIAKKQVDFVCKHDFYMKMNSLYLIYKKK